MIKDFYALPKFLFGQGYVTLTNDARVLYALLLDRFETDKRIDEAGKAYLIFTREAMSQALLVSDKSARRAVVLLKGCALLTEERPGWMRANAIYLNFPER